MVVDVDKGAMRLSLEIIIITAIGIAVAIGLYFLIGKGVRGPAKNLVGFAKSLKINLTRLW